MLGERGGRGRLGGAAGRAGQIRASRATVPPRASRFERAYGATHYEIAVNLNNLAAVYQATGRGEQAEQLYRRALEMKEDLLGPEHPDVAVTLNNLALLYKSQGRCREAEPLYRRSLTILTDALGPSQPKVITCRENHAALEQSLGLCVGKPAEVPQPFRRRGAVETDPTWRTGIFIDHRLAK